MRETEERKDEEGKDKGQDREMTKVIKETMSSEYHFGRIRSSRMTFLLLFFD